MPAALPKFKAAIFNNPQDLVAFVTNGSSTVASIVTITSDNDGKWVLWYIST